MDLGIDKDVDKQGLTAVEEEVAMRVVKVRGEEGFIREKGFEGGARVFEGLEVEVYKKIWKWQW